jgi:hypothetical protein
LGELRGEAPIRHKTAEAAQRAAAHLGETKAGAIAFSSSGDVDLGDFDEELVILSVVGRASADLLQ